MNRPHVRLTSCKGQSHSRPIACTRSHMAKCQVSKGLCYKFPLELTDVRFRQLARLLAVIGLLSLDAFPCASPRIPWIHESERLNSTVRSVKTFKRCAVCAVQYSLLKYRAPGPWLEGSRSLKWVALLPFVSGLTRRPGAWSSNRRKKRRTRQLSRKPPTSFRPSCWGSKFR